MPPTPWTNTTKHVNGLCAKWILWRHPRYSVLGPLAFGPLLFPGNFSASSSSPTPHSIQALQLLISTLGLGYSLSHAHANCRHVAALDPKIRAGEAGRDSGIRRGKYSKVKALLVSFQKKNIAGANRKH